VIDIGGQLSHAAIVARELGLPCVVNTQTGTRRLATGDQVRVDGRAGTVTRSIEQNKFDQEEGETVKTQWGPLATPIAAEADIPGLHETGRPWKDNAFFGIWDVDREIYGIIHFSTSPNGGGRRARCSISARGRVAEIIEPLQVGTFNSASIALDLQGRITVEHDRIRLDLQMEPRSGPTDFASGQPLPPLAENLPLQHWEQSFVATGPISIGDEDHSFDGRGYRDRTFGWRDETAQWTEYTWVVATFDDFDLTTGKMRGIDGVERVRGYRIIGENQELITGFSVSRDASGMYRGGTTTFESGPPLVITESVRRTGFWLPMGADDQEGPVFSAFDELVELRTAEGDVGFGIAEHGILRHVT
jgi:PEP-utilising enzyme, mobile domain